MSYTRKKTTKRSTRKNIVLGVVTLVGLLGIVGALEKLHVINLYERKPAPAASNENEAKTTSTAASAQEDFTGGTDKQPSTANTSEGTVKDNNGSVGTVPSASTWTVSSDKAITVYSPAKSGLVSTGFTFSGASTHQTVEFRLIDDVSGVIAQGSVKVSGGKYSGTFSFTSKGTAGRLDVYSANEDGVESSSVSVPVRYK